MFNKGKDDLPEEVLAKLTPLLERIQSGVDRVNEQLENFTLDHDGSPGGCEQAVCETEPALDQEPDGPANPAPDSVAADELPESAQDSGLTDSASSLSEEFQGQIEALQLKHDLEIQKFSEDRETLAQTEKALEQVRNDLGGSRSELEQARSQLKDAEDNTSGCLQNLRAVEEKREQLASERNDYQTKFDQASGQLKELGMNLTEHQSSITLLLESERKLTGELDLCSVEKQRSEETVAGLRKQLQADERLEMLMWPDFLSEGPLKEWRLKLEDAIMQETPNENAVLLVACLFNYNAAKNFGKEWQKRLIDVLHDFSWALFRWSGELQYSPDQAVEEARQWAEAFNEVCSDVLRISIPEPEAPFDKRTMVTYESGGAGTTLDVHSVRTWCIQDSNGRIMKQAEVTTS